MARDMAQQAIEHYLTCMVGNPLNTEVCAGDKPSDYDSSWTSETCKTSECTGTDTEGTDTEGTGGEGTGGEGGLAQVESYDDSEDTIYELAQVEGKKIDAIEELAQVEVGAVYDYWAPENCKPGMFC